MSNQIQITGGAKVRSLEGVITGTSGVLSSVPLGAANGVATLDSGGKVPVSQLPASVVTYLGTWNATTNTPTLVNGTGDAGDLYICNVAGTVNFGAGPITFAVGDWVLYGSGTWQKSSGQNGTVTSVAASITGNSLGITGSPITNAGTLAFAFAGTNLQYVNGAGNLTTFPTLISSIGLSMPSAFSVSNSPLTANGTIAVTGAGNASQYIRGDGSLAAYNPSSGGGGSSQTFYFNGGVASSVVGYEQMSTTANTGTSADFSISADGYIASFLTDVGSPNQLNIPAGNWNFEIYMNSNSSGGSPSFYVELYKYASSTFTLIATSSANPEYITNGTSVDLYITALAVPSIVLTVTDRLAVRVYVIHSSKTITMHTQDSNLSSVITTFSTGITALNGLTAQVQYFATGTSGTDFAISSSTATHTFNLPTASASNTGKLSSTDWSTFNGKIGGSGSSGQVAFFNGGSTLTGSTNFYWDNSTSRLGIGTNTPNASLGILNSSSTGLQIRTSDTSNQYQANIYWDSSYGMVYGYNRTGASTTAHNLTFYNALGGFLSVPESSNNNIGFNTLNPQGSSATTVYDFTSISTSVEIRLHNPTTGYTSTDGSYIKVTPTALVIANVETASQILINNGGSGVVTIDGTNNVAIGNIGVIPMTQQLTVVGSIQAYGGSIYQTVTSSMLKANSSGQIIAAVGGTDYEYPLTFSSPLVRTTNTISIPAATTSVNGYLTSTDWNTFNNKGSGTVTSVTGTAPVVSSGGTTPAISMAAATTSVSGYLTSTDWNTFNGKFTLPSLTSGSILFSNGSTIAQNNTRLYWDNTNMRLGIGTQSVSQYVTYIAANVGENANAWLGIENKNTTGSTAVRLLLNGSTTSGFQYVQSTNMTQVYANGGPIQIINSSSLGLTIANTTGAATFDSSATATSFVKTGGTSSQFLKADGSVDSNSYYLASNPSGFTSNTGTVTSVATSAPLTGGTITTSGTIGITQATTSTNGYLSSTDWNTFNNKTTLPSLTSGSVLFSDGSTIAQDNTNFFFDNTYKALKITSSSNGLETGNPYPLHVKGVNSIIMAENTNTTGTAAIRIKLNSFIQSTYQYSSTTGATTISSNYSDLRLLSGSGNGIWIANSTGNVSINNFTDSGYKLDVTGTGRFTGSLSANGVMSLGDDGTYGSTYKTLGLTGNSNGSHRIFGGTADNLYVAAATGRGIYLCTNGTTTPNLTIASGGAATFSSSVQNTGLLKSINTYVSDTTVYQKFNDNTGYDLNFGGTASGFKWLQVQDASGLASYASLLLNPLGGNVGIGTSSPNNLLVVSGSTGSMRLEATSTNRSAITIQNTGNALYMGIENSSGTYFGATAYSANFQAGNYPMIFWTNNTERMRITSGGGINMPTVYSSYSSGNAANVYMGAGGALYVGISSIKYKKDIRNYDKGLAEVLKMRPVYYKGISDYDGDTQFAGLIAEEIEELGLKEFVVYEEDGTPRSLAYASMVTILTKAIQELSAKNDALETRLQLLENK